MKEQIVELKEDVSSSPLYSEDLAPVPKEKRTWKMLDLAAIWVGMAVCIPTYILASYMIKTGLSWYAALIIIGLANLIITVPMVLNGHAGVKYGIPFPVLGRASFGIHGIHIASIIRAIVACGWFGVQTWIGGLAIYAIWNASTGSTPSVGLDIGKFIGFAIFWFINIYFIWKGTESIKWLEDFAAPILVIIGLVLIIWGSLEAGSFSTVISQGKQMQKPSAELNLQNEELTVKLAPLVNKDGTFKASEYQLKVPTETSLYESQWTLLSKGANEINLSGTIEGVSRESLSDNRKVEVQFRTPLEEDYIYSSIIQLELADDKKATFGGTFWGYLLWLTAMVGFWATMSLSIADITRYASTQKEQVTGQFLGLPGTMVLYSFVGIFVTFAAIVNFQDILIAEDAPWDPVSFLAKFSNPTVVIISQVFMIIATLSTNIAANVIAPANAFSNLYPKRISFRMGGLITGIIGIIICPWLLLDEISGFLISISAFLGPVLGILLCDYFVIRKKNLSLADLYKTQGSYTYTKGFNLNAILAFLVGLALAYIGRWVPALEFLWNLSWFTGFFISFFLYWMLMANHPSKSSPT